MPYPTQVTPEQIVAQAHSLLERDGTGRLALSELASALGVKAPSLYRYFTGKDELLRAVNLATASEMVAAMEEAAAPIDDARDKLLAMALACRGFGHANPVTYRLAFTNSDTTLRPDEARLEALVIPIQRVMAELSGATQSLAALRGIWALIHGFTLFELSGQFRRGGDLEAAFVQAVEAYLNGWRA